MRMFALISLHLLFFKGFHKQVVMFLLCTTSLTTKQAPLQGCLLVFKRLIFRQRSMSVMKYAWLSESKLQSLSLERCLSNICPDFHQNHTQGMNTITRGQCIPWQIHCMHLHAILIRMHVFNYLCPQHKLNRLIFRLFYYHVCTYQYFQFKTILHQRTKVIFFRSKRFQGQSKPRVPKY